jgi:hypothetical protein
MFAWLVATNHCALGLMQRASELTVDHAYCHGCKPKQEDQPTNTLECCKAMQATPAKADNSVKVRAAGIDLEFFALVRLLGPVQAGPLRQIFIFDHGPPRALSFAESVLQRSLPGNAPPLAL